MAKNKISDLRDHLFETLEALKDPDKPMDLNRARAISEVAQTIINTAKVEVEMVRAINGSAPTSGFFGAAPELNARPLRIAEARKVSGSS